MTMTEAPCPAREDQKLITLARAARARIGAPTGAAVRDETGRSYTGADVALPSLRLTAGTGPRHGGGLRRPRGRRRGRRGAGSTDVAVVREVGGAGVTIWLADGAGTVTAMVST